MEVGRYCRVICQCQCVSIILSVHLLSVYVCVCVCVCVCGRRHCIWPSSPVRLKSSCVYWKLVHRPIVLIEEV